MRTALKADAFLFVIRFFKADAFLPPGNCSTGSRALSKTKMTPADATPSKWTMYSDASMAGWGAVIISSEGSVHSTGAKWLPEHAGLSINVLEAEAVRNGLHDLQSHLQGCTVDLRIDNTSCISAIRRQYAASAGLNATSDAVQELARQLSIQIGTVKYVASSDNPSDANSRGYSLSNTSYRHMHQHALGTSKLATGPGPRELDSRRSLASVSS